MGIKTEEIRQILQYGEHISLECKEAKNALPKSVWETYSAFANTSGGLILLGVKEERMMDEAEHRFCISGVFDADKLIQDFWNTLNSEKVNVNILVDSDIEELQVDGETIVSIKVPQADYKQKPVYINGNPIKGTFKRRHEGDYHCSEDEVKAMLRDASDSGNDGGLLFGYGMDDIDTESLKAYRIEYELRNPDHIWNNLDNKEFLRNLGGYAVNRQTGEEALTLAGLLMFGKGLPIRERFDNIHMDYIDETGLTGERRWSDRLTYDGMWENNLYNFLKRVMPKLVSDLKRPFKLKGMNRDDDTAIHKAIREAFVNLIIHSDYLITGVLKIVKKDDGFVFSNPGSLKLPVEMIYEGGNSKARNPRIQTMLRMIGLGDNIGSGFPAILAAWGEEQWRKPDLSENMDLHQVELKLWMISLMPAECTEYLQSILGEDYTELTSEEQIILCTAYLEKNVSNKRMQAILNMHPADVGKHLYRLVHNGMLIANNRGRWTTYNLNEEYETQSVQLTLPELSSTETVLNKTDQAIYLYIKENQLITAQQVIEITRITTTAGASVALNRLIGMGLIKKSRNGRHIYYELQEEKS